MQACTLTTKDFTILEVMYDRCLERSGPMAALLRRKLEAATVVFRDDVEPEVATLSSRVAFRLDGRGPESRILSHDAMASATGLFLPVTTLNGLALLGLSEGQELRFETDTGERHVLLQEVLYQPEAARRERERLARSATPAMRRTALRVVPGAFGEG
jgi:regulator of nucleoside diphosphate kinase